MTDRPTPLTDAAILVVPLWQECDDPVSTEIVHPAFARDLERKLADSEKVASDLATIYGKSLARNIELERKLAEAREALQWAQGELGKHTRPSPIDKALARINAKGTP